MGYGGPDQSWLVVGMLVRLRSCSVEFADVSGGRRRSPFGRGEATSATGLPHTARAKCSTLGGWFIASSVGDCGIARDQSPEASRGSLPTPSGMPI